VFLTACETILGSYDIYDQDNPSLEALTGNPTPAIIYSTAQGLLDAWRSGDVAGGEGGWLQDLSCFGREGYYLAPARTILDEFDDALVPSGGLGWGNTYATIRNVNGLLAAVEEVGPMMDDAKKEGVRGWVKTIEATLLLRQIRIQDDFGIPIDTDRPIDDLAPIATKPQVYAYILERFDEAKSHLQSAGAEFGFELSPGFAGFDTPATFLQVNRALKARAANDIGDAAATTAALSESFIDENADMALGAYHSWGEGAGDALMPVSDPAGVRYLADTTLMTDAQLQANGEVDLRVTTKTDSVPPLTHTGVTSNLRWRLYENGTDSSPIIKNEELLLIRAEVNLDTDAALADINTVRTASGGLQPIPLGTWQAMTHDERVTELLYNRRYSLVWEWGHRWVDMRRFDRLDQLVGPRGAGDRVFDKVPFPEDECIVRDYAPEGCSTVEGFRTTS
jgi:hypothetical protein